MIEGHADVCGHQATTSEGDLVWCVLLRGHPPREFFGAGHEYYKSPPPLYPAHRKEDEDAFWKHSFWAAFPGGWASASSDKSGAERAADAADEAVAAAKRRGRL